MSILSTNKKLISIGAEYSAGQGIDISGHIISVVESAVGANYSAGPNIDIYDVEGQPTISSKDWSSDIADASANAYEQAIAQIPAPQDLSYISAKVDTNTSGINYISSVCLTAHQDWTDTIKGASSYSYEQSTSYFDNWVNGQYTGDVTNITNKISALSGDFSDYYKKTETSSKDEINDALQYVSANAGKVYEGVSPIVVNNDENKVSADTWTFSAGSNVSFVDDNVNKITRIDVELPQPQDLSYISAQVDSANAGVDYLSGVVITALPSDLATTGDVNDLAQSVSETYQTKGDYAERAFVLSSIESATSGKLDVSSFSSVSSDFLTNDDLNGYATEQWVENKGYLTAVDLSDYAKNSALSSTSSFLSGAIDYVSANAGGGTYVVSGNDGGLAYISAEDAGAIYGKPYNGTYSGFFSAVSINQSNPIVNNSISITCPKNTVITHFGVNSWESVKYKTSEDGEWLGPSSYFETDCNFVSNNGVVAIPISSTTNTPPMTLSAYELYNIEDKLVIPPFIDVDGFVKKSDSKLEIGNGASATSESFALGYNSAYNQSFAQGSYNSAANQSLAQGSYNSANNYSLVQGYKNSAYGYSLAQGEYNRAKSDSLSQGINNSANNYSLAQGSTNSSNSFSLAQGSNNSANRYSLAQGQGNSAYIYSLAQGYHNSADNYSIAQGQWNYASNCSQAFGYYTSATNSGMAIGVFNKNTSAAFVVGNGTWSNHSDAFIIYRDGSVSAAGKISANGVELGAGGGVTGDFVPQSAFDELKQSYDALSSLFATYSGQWLLPNEGV